MRTRAIDDLRLTVRCLPTHTKRAMLEAIRSTDIIVGAYSSDEGICPMLAAHRAGGRTNFISFARAWDRFAGATRPRRATTRELSILAAHLEASLLEDEGPAPDLAAAVAEHRELVARHAEAAAARAAAEHQRRRRRWSRPRRRARAQSAYL
jgi:hypothetical protein